MNAERLNISITLIFIDYFYTFNHDRCLVIIIELTVIDDIRL